MSGGTNLDQLLATMQPVVNSGEFVFVSQESHADVPVYATVREAEGITHVLSRGDADDLGWAYDYVAAWITVEVHSALEAVGLTAAVSTVLADAGISCNILAGYFHDHLLVPYDRAAEAVELLRGLSERHR